MTESNIIYQQVLSHYSTLAQNAAPDYSDTLARAFGYSQEELYSIPTEANLGVSCGNPLAIASIREGETVVDLGSGAGFDVFLASRKVGALGRAIGVDINQHMLARARRNQAKSPKTRNVSFIEANIISIPLEDGIADCIISNCVINLVPEGDKPQVFAEMARLLKTGGRVAISDTLTRKPLPHTLRDSVASYVGCIAGASAQEDYHRWLKDAGFDGIAIIDAKVDLNIYATMAKNAESEQGTAVSCCELPVHKGKSDYTQDKDTATCCVDATASPCCNSPSGGRNVPISKRTEVKEQETMAARYDHSTTDINEWAGSFKIFAVKK